MTLFLIAAVAITIAPVDKAAPNRQPQMAASKTLTAIVFGSQNGMWFAASKDHAESFSRPVQIPTTGILALGRHRGPHVVISGKAIVVSAVYGKKGGGSDGDLMAWRSEDEGRTWSQPITINDVPAAAREGLHAMTANANGILAAAWLDLRAKGTRLYGAYSNDAGKTWSSNVLLFQSPDGTICQCCSPSLTAASDDGFEVMFRNAMGGYRDMSVLDWQTSGKKVGAPVKVGVGSWQLNACPMDGGGVANIDGKTVTAWRRKETVFLDEAGKPETVLGNGRDVAIAGTKRGAYVSWTSANGIQVHSPGRPTITELGNGAFSNLLALSNGEVAAAWEQDGEIKVSIVH